MMHPVSRCPSSSFSHWGTTPILLEFLYRGQRKRWRCSSSRHYRPKQPNHGQQSSPAGAIFSGEPFDQLNDYREGLSFWSFVWSLRLVLCANGWCSIVATAQCWGWSCGILLSGLLPARFLGEILDWVEMYLSRFLVLRKQILCM